jgi:uncharacterized protein YcbX
MAQLDAIFVHPIKSLDPAPVESACIVTNGALAWDRRYAILDEDGEYVNGKREQRIHRVRSTFDLDAGTVTLREQDGDPRTFHLDDDRAELESWLESVVGYPVDVVRDDEGGYPDDTDASGPTVISAATVERVASWYDDIPPTEMRRRLRPNLVVADGPAFWEDRLYADPDSVVPFEVGSVRLQGVNPCQRCVVPTRDPDTGDPTEGFQERFVQRRRETLPDWAGEAWFDHYFRLMVNTRVPRSEWNETLAVGDEVRGPLDAQPSENFE